MAKTTNRVEAPVDDVWAVLIDPHTYPDWLIGAERIRAVDDGWPRPGTKFHHRVGMGPVKVNDWSASVEVEPPTRLVLDVRATPIVRAIVTFTLRRVESGTEVELIEEPKNRLFGNLVRPVMDPLTHLRNKGSLERFAEIVRRRSSPGA